MGISWDSRDLKQGLLNRLLRPCLDEGSIPTNPLVASVAGTPPSGLVAVKALSAELEQFQKQEQLQQLRALQAAVTKARASAGLSSPSVSQRKLRLRCFYVGRNYIDYLFYAVEEFCQHDVLRVSNVQLAKYSCTVLEVHPYNVHTMISEWCCFFLLSLISL